MRSLRVANHKLSVFNYAGPAIFGLAVRCAVGHSKLDTKYTSHLIIDAQNIACRSILGTRSPIIPIADGCLWPVTQSGSAAMAIS